MMDIQIGSRLFSKERYGRSNWESQEIVGETKQSWLIGNRNFPTKVNKKTMLENLKQYGARHWYTAEGASDKDWRDRNVYKLSKIVECQDTAILKRIAEIVGYTEATP